MLRDFYSSCNILWHSLFNLLVKATIWVQEQLGLFSYARWVKEKNKDNVRWATTTSNCDYSEKICFLLVVNRDEPSLLLETIRSCKNLLNSSWELFLIFDSEMNFEFDKSTLEDQRITILRNDNPYEIIEEHFLGEQSKWVTFIELGDQFSPLFVHEALKALHMSPDSEIIYLDEDYLLPNGQRRPYLKPNWSPESMLSSDLLSLPIISTKLLKRLVSQGVVLDFSRTTWLYSLAAHASSIIHLPKILYHRHALHPSFQINCEVTSRVDMVKAYLASYSVGEVDVSIDINGIRVFWEIVGPPLVSVIIPTKDNYELIRKLIDSVSEKTKYAPFEIIIVDNGSTDNDVLSYYRKMGNDRHFQVLFFDEPFNYSRYNNIGAKYARGEVLIFLNNDMEVISPDWMEELVRWAMLPEIGAVGGMLLYPDGIIQHAGIVIGLQGHASHVFLGESPDVRTIFGRPTWYRNVSAVTGACLAVRKEVFEQVGGFDENLVLAFNDVEFCVRLIKAGYRNLYNPFVRLFHYEGRSRGKYIPAGDIIYGYEILKDIVAEGDPYFNPNLSHLMNTPTLRRSFEGSPSERLEWIRANAVRKLKKND